MNLLRRTSSLVLAAVMATLTLAAGPARAQSWSAPVTKISAVTTTTTSSAVDTSSATSACVQFTSASTSTATGEVLISVNGTSYDSAISTSDPTSDGAVLCGPTGRSLKAKVTRSAGTLSAHVIYRSFPGDPFAVGGWRRISVGANSFGALAVTSLTDSGLTSGRFALVSTGGLLADNSGITYSGSGITATSFTGSLIGTQQDTVAAKGSNGAISSAPGTILITKGTALGSSTLATPTVTTHDGYILRIVSTTAAAHVVSVASGKVNGGSNTTITFTSAAIGDSVTLLAYQGVWYVIDTTGTITIS